MINIKTFIGCALMPFLLISCQSDEHDHDHDQLATGKSLFEEHCSTCHRQDGNGMFLKGYPPIRSTEMDSWQISHKIRGEEEGRNMPSFSDMTEAEATKIANYVKSLKTQ